MQNHRRGIDHQGFSHTPGTQTVHRKHITLKLRRCCACDCQLCVAVGGTGQHRRQQHFDALTGKLTRGFGKPHVVTDRQAKPPDLGHIKDTELRPGRDTGFIGPEREHLGVTANNLALGVDHDGSVVHTPVFRVFQEHRPGDQPDAVLACGCLKHL